jgi:hypothetical protein
MAPICNLHSMLLRITVKLGYNELGYSEHSVITNKFLSQIGYFNTQINPVITNPGYNEQKWPVPSCSL